MPRNRSVLTVAWDLQVNVLPHELTLYPSPNEPTVSRTYVYNKEITTRNPEKVGFMLMP